MAEAATAVLGTATVGLDAVCLFGTVGAGDAGVEGLAEVVTVAAVIEPSLAGATGGSTGGTGAGTATVGVIVVMGVGAGTAATTTPGVEVVTEELVAGDCVLLA